MSSGAETAADAAAPREPLAVRIIGRGSLAGALVVIAVALVYLVALPTAARLVAAPPPAIIIQVGEGASVSTTGDWVRDPESDAVALTQSGATLTFSPPAPTEGSAEDAVAAFTDRQLDQARPGAVATAPRVFETEAGYQAATVIVQDSLETTQSWVVTDGVTQVVATLVAPPAAWDTVSGSAQLVVRSLRLPEATS